MRINNIKLIATAVLMVVSQFSQAGSTTPQNPIYVSGQAGMGLIGEYDTAVGENAGNNSNGSSNTFVAVNAGVGLIGNSNNVIGANAGKNLNGNGNSIFGDSTGRSVQGSSNSIFGSGFSCSYQCFNIQELIGSSNALLGNPSYTKIHGDNNIGIGSFAGSVEGSENIAIGLSAGAGLDQFLNPRAVTSGISIGSYSSARALRSNATGYLAIVEGNPESNIGIDGIAFGTQAAVRGGQEAMAIGPYSLATADGSVALGSHSIADVAYTVSVGSPGFERRIMNVGNAVLGTDAVNLKQVQGLISAIPSSSTTPVVIPPLSNQPTAPIAGLDIGADYTAVGIGAKAQSTNLALGTNAQANGINSAAIGNGSKTSVEDVSVVSFGDANLQITRRLTNLTDGYLSSDAATVGQVTNLYNSIVSLIPIQLSPVETPVAVLPSKPAFTPTDANGNTNVGDGTATGSTGSNNTNAGLNAGSANAGDGNVFVGNNTGSTSGNSSNAVALGNGAKSGSNGVALGAGSVASDGTVSVGTVGAERQIKNVAAGTDATDAVNLAQLGAVANTANAAKSAAQSNSDALNGLNNKIDTGINSVRNEIKDVARRSYGGTALALAISSGNQTRAGEAIVQVGVGSFNGESAIAVGTSMANSQGTIFSLGAGVTSQSDIGIKAAVSFTFNPEWLK